MHNKIFKWFKVGSSERDNSGVRQKIKDWVLRPFQEYFNYIEPIFNQRWAKAGVPGEK